MKNKELEDYVKEVDYKALNNNYVPSVEALMMVNFIKMVNGSKGEENKTPVMHLIMYDDLIHKNDNLFVVHRGGAKTTVIHEYVFLYIATYGEFFKWGKQQVAIYVSDTMENGIRNMREQLEFRWRESAFLQQYIPYAKFTEDRWEFKNVEGNKFFVKGFAAMTGVRGFKKYGTRPTWCGFDDLLSDKNAKSPTILKDIENVIYQAAAEALHPSNRKVCWTGTPFSKKDSLYKAVGSDAWNVRVFPICEKFPCKKEEFSGSWDDRFTYESTLENYTKKLKNGKVSAFNQELMLKIASEEDRIIQDCDINWYSRPTLLSNKHSYNYYITTDFATSEKQSADYSVISVWAYNNKGMWFLVDGVCKRQLMDQNINDLFRLAQEYQPQSVGVEVTGQQGGFIQWIQGEMLRRNQWFSLASEGNSNKAGVRPVSNKMVRFNTVVPWFKQGIIFLPEEWRGSHELVIEMEDELVSATMDGFKSKHDDVCSSGDSLIKELLPNGTVVTCRFDQLQEGSLVQGYCEVTKAYKWVEVQTLCLTGYKSTFTVEVTGRGELHLTDNHTVLTQRGWVEVGGLTLEDSIVCKKRDMVISELVPVKRIYLKSLGEPVYNFTTETHTYCLADGVVVHNCDTVSMLSVLKPWKPSVEQRMVKDTSGIWEDSFIYEEDSGDLGSYIV